jgi:hypothetical protein
MNKCPTHNNYRVCLSKFSILEVDRDDNKILSFDTETLKNSIHCEIILIKILIIRLRRAKSNSDWLLFKFLVEKNIDIILNYRRPRNRKGLSPRWLISILETYVDHGDEIEASNALIVSTFHKNERFFATICDYFTIESKNYFYNCKKEFCGIDIYGNHDIVEQYLKRIYRQLSKTPIILSFFEKIFEEILKKTDSTYSILLRICNDKIFFKPIKEIFYKDEDKKFLDKSIKIF